MIEVELTWTEVATAARIGETRYLRALGRKRQETTGRDQRINPWNSHIEGACAELATAKALGVYWPMNVEPDYGGDLGPGIHVRSSALPNGSLILHDEDEDGIYYAVFGETRSWRVAGWARVPDARLQTYWREKSERIPHAAYFIPQRDLSDPTEEPR